ncbi:MAG: CHAT domain-containing protein, partial [Microcystaceae cyanobacterium]
TNNSQTTTSTAGRGDAGNITIPNAQNINLNNSNINASTSGEGDTGKIELSASDTLQLNNNSEISSSVEKGAIGNSQQITLNTPNLTLTNSTIKAETAGVGNAGSIDTLNTQFLTLDNSTISTEITSTGEATLPSNITLNTQQLSLTNNSQITNSKEGIGDAGNINLTGNTFNLTQGSQIRTTTSSDNNAGNINLKFIDEIYLTGEDTGIFANTTQNSTGNSGSIFIDPINVIIENGASIAVDAQGSGQSGNITLFADYLTLNQGTISAQSTSGDGGNIFLNIDNRLTLLNNSLISTTAGNQQQGGNGGNITILADSIITLPGDNSDITANAFSGDGGNINITTQEILWIQPRNLLTPFSDITASSELGAEGVITINEQNIKPPEDTVTINAELVDPNTLISQNVCKKGINSEFIVTGQGGLPLNPTDPLNAILVWEDLGNIEQNSDNLEISSLKSNSLNLTQLSEKGNASYQAENYDQAIKLWENGLQNLDNSSNKLLKAEILTNLALAYQKVGKIDQATETATHSIDILKSQPQNAETLSLLARALNNQGVLQLTWGQSQSALNSFKQATQLYQQNKLTNAENKGSLNQVYALKDLGRNQAAIALLNPLYHQQKNQPDSSLKADIHRLYGEIAHAMGQDKLSQDLLQQSLTIAYNSQDQAQIASSELSLVNINQFQDKYSQQTPLSVDLLALINQFSSNVEQNQVKDAQRLIPEIEAKIKQLSPSRSLIYAQINYALSLHQLSQKESNLNLSLSASINHLNDALKTAQTIGDQRGEAYSLGYLGYLYENQKQWSNALNITQKALSLSQQLQSSDLIYQWQWQLGRILQHQNQKEQALSAYQSAYQEIESLRQELVGINPERQFSFKETVEPLYRELVSQLLDGTPSQTNLQQARQIIESLQLAELDNFFQDGCTQAKPQQIDQIDPNAAVIYPIVLKNSIGVIISSANKPLDYHSIPITDNQIKQTIDNLYITLNPKIDPKPFINSQNILQPHQTLYDWLIRPLESKLQQNKVNTLVFVLDQGLQNIPPAMLHDGQQYLIEKYNVVLTPGLQLLDSSPLTTQALNSVLGGLAEERQGFSALPGVKQELTAISQKINSEILLDEDFNRPNLQQQINNSNSPIVHLATHGQFSSQAENTFLVAWDGLINVKELSQLLENRQYSPTPIELLILSACQTAQGDSRATLGLAGVAVRSGSRSTLATLWSVQDESTAQLMIKFYEILGNESISKAEALRKAQLSLISSEQYNNPYYWGAFVLVGNWK